MPGSVGIPLSLDYVLEIATQIGWWVFAIYAVIVFFRIMWQRGFRRAVIALFSYRVMLPLLLILSVSLLSSAIVFVYPQQGAVVVSLISPGGIRPQPVRAGLHVIFPYLERDVRYPIFWQTYTMSHLPEEGTELGNDSIRARTSDGQEVRLSCSVIFRLDFEQLVTVHIDWQDRYIQELVRPLTRGFVRTQVSQFTVREVNSSVRKALEATLDQRLRQALADKGFILDQFLLRDITFTTEYAEAVELKQVAFEGEEEKAHEAQQIRNLAEGQAEAIRIEARAQAEAVELIAQALKKNADVLTYRYIEKLSPNIRVMLVPTDTPLILPLPKLGDGGATESQEVTIPALTSIPTPPAPSQ
ncbi:MAG: prohibitin family protein [Candidatus Tectomicrobia bacterium]|nr:prohibitin family protein [Candidatus Tectomicrobia bacterium]